MIAPLTLVDPEAADKMSRLPVWIVGLPGRQAAALTPRWCPRARVCTLDSPRRVRIGKAKNQCDSEANLAKFRSDPILSRALPPQGQRSQRDLSRHRAPSRADM